MSGLFGFIFLLIFAGTSTYLKYKRSDNIHRLKKVQNSQRYYRAELEKLKEEMGRINGKLQKYEGRHKG